MNVISDHRQMPIEDWTQLVTRILAPNPGPMTLEGTNSFVVRDPGSASVVVVDPGPADAMHMKILQRFGRIELVLLTHGHHDHSESAARLSRITGAPVRAIDPELTIGAAPLTPGETINAGGCQITVLASPGHTSDSVCFWLPRDRALDWWTSGSVLTGDTVLGSTTTVITEPSGSLTDYLATLDLLKALGPVLGLPGHGPMIPDIEHASRVLTFHRHRRLRQIVDAVGNEPMPDCTDPVAIDRLTHHIYRRLHPALVEAAKSTVRAHLAHLATRGGLGTVKEDT